MVFSNFDITILILDELFDSFRLDEKYLNLRLINRTFNFFILKIIFKNPFKYIKNQLLLIALYIHFTDDLTNAKFLINHLIDLKLISLTYLTKRNIDKDRFENFVRHTEIFRKSLKEFDYYEFICSFCELCVASNSTFSVINRFDLYPTKLEISLQQILKYNVFVDGVDLSTLNFYLLSKKVKNDRLFWKDRLTTLSSFFENMASNEFLQNVKQVKFRVDFVDRDVMLILSKLDQVEMIEVEFHDDDIKLEEFSICFKSLIDDYSKLKSLIFKRWNWNDKTIPIFNIFYNNNLKKIEMIENKITSEKFWNFPNLNMSSLKYCGIYYWVMQMATVEFRDKLIMKNKIGYMEIYSTKE